MADKNPTVTIEMEQGGEIVIELDPTNAPNTVKNFIALASSGFYDGLTFHRVIPGFMVQGGCPEGFGTGDPGYRIKGEFEANKHENKLKHKRGVISMARAQPNDSAGCQFFIMDKPSSHLDGQYAAFGEVKQGLDVIDRIVSVATDPNDKPLEKQTIKRITVETYGVEYEPPEKL